MSVFEERVRRAAWCKQWRAYFPVTPLLSCLSFSLSIYTITQHKAQCVSGLGSGRGAVLTV